MNPTSLKVVSKCRRCITLGEDHVPSEGSRTAEVMFIGQSPGATEVEKGRPFIGPCGELLDYLLDEAELERAQVYIANVLKCRPPNNRPGHKEEIDTCMGAWLKMELAKVNPRVVVLLGRDAHTAVLKDRVPFGNGVVTRSKKRIYLTIYHPGFYLRRGNIEEFVSQGSVLKELLEERL